MLNFVSINYHIKHNDVTNIAIDGEETILDADVVIVDPSRFQHLWEKHLTSHRDGTPTVNSPASDQIRRIFDSRKNEINTLLKNGKIIIVFLQPLSGFSGGNKEEMSYTITTNYDFLPIHKSFLLENLKSGRSDIENSILLKNPASIFSQYFRGFKDMLSYRAYLDVESDQQNLNFLTNRSKKPVGFHLQVENGLIAFLPNLNSQFDSNKLIGILASCCKNFIRKKETSPPPIWVDNFELDGENQLEKEISVIRKEINSYKEELEKIKSQKNEITKFKELLYETGTELENVVIEAFKLFGFTAENREQEDLEHDIIFESNEGKGIAEVEGKDNDAIHINKFDQLNRAVDEDFYLTEEYSQGILIGNHYRFIAPIKRNPPFTDKVFTVAQKKSYGLLSTHEIYRAVDKILKEPKNNSFKKLCRERILKTEGELIKLIN